MILLVIKVNRKWIILLLGVVLLFLVVFGSTMAGQVSEVDSEYDGAYYVEANGNLIIKFAKLIDKGCFYVVDIVVSGVGSIVDSILGN